jgi:sulfate adenylyltransferase subunit 1
VKAAFVQGSLKANGDIFEEYYYNLDSMSVSKVRNQGQTYTIGDEIPVSGDSYAYPDSFDVVVLRDKVAVQIRERRVATIMRLSDYTYGGLPVINGRGFEVRVSSQKELDEFKGELSALNDNITSEFFNKWVKFETYRKIVFRDEVWS